MNSNGSLPDQPYHHFDPNGLYILITGQGLFSPHWGLYLHKEGREGQKFQIANVDGPWRHAGGPTKSVVTSKNLSVALKVATIQPEKHETVSKCAFDLPLIDYQMFGNIDCRTWVQQVLYDLNADRIINLPEKEIKRIPGEEVKALLAEAKREDTCIVTESRFYRE
ncbi:hypothetical protein GLAREA_02186 [Glarea lozoyensis ATCC 20868]|uniref:Uncharacterized protein n=1 Tax=Glarea lozoyensis (strain ATCC 20868 / MF5171) TaxID=1116229 RepID=S3CM60_GLAL2|nr:uncharacterized protein GLAREA_02186 [Glarea lozoyensis ATCC 20868]EPE26274.1 hypothetical protein GLAREA_02186 [Glarea lozoyensis ATCC 20868]